MRNRIELLRAIEFTKDDLDNIINLDDIDEYSDKDKEFMEDFKKIYELGLNQLEIFINKLDEEGSELDEYSIKYYIQSLLNGPLGQYARKLGEGKNYFVDTPDIMGISGNNTKSANDTTILPGYPVSLGASVDLYNKIPPFMQDLLEKSVEQVEENFRGTLFASTLIDNTLPLVDKAPSVRYQIENSGRLVLRSNASYLVKDSYTRIVFETLNSTLFDQIKEYLGDENYRIFLDNKTFTRYADDSTSSNFEIKRQYGEEEFSLDLLGNVNDSFEKRKNVLKVSNAEKEVEYILNSNEGQLGNL